MEALLREGTHSCKVRQTPSGAPRRAGVKTNPQQRALCVHMELAVGCVATTTSASGERERAEASAPHGHGNGLASRFRDRVQARRVKQRGGGERWETLRSLGEAVAALEQGAGSSFLQTPAASAIRTYAMERANLPDASREELVAFLSSSEEGRYAPQSGEITGILKQMGDEMSADLADDTKQENDAIKNYEELTAAKEKEALHMGTVGGLEAAVSFADLVPLGAMLGSGCRRRCGGLLEIHRRPSRLRLGAAPVHVEDCR